MMDSRDRGRDPDEDEVKRKSQEENDSYDQNRSQKCEEEWFAR